MSHYEEKLQRDLDNLHNKVQHLGKMAEDSVRSAVRALMKLDMELATNTIIGDLAVNRGSQEIDQLCHAFVARHLPSAGNLRYVSSVLRTSHILERIGDYAETICRTVLQLSSVPPDILMRDIEQLSDQSLRIFHQALKAFSKRNADLARGTLEMSTQFTKTVDQTYADIVQEGERSSRPIADVLAFLACFNRLQRIIHQAKNICEETIFVATGQKKRRKRFNFLFTDESNSGPSQLAEAFARKVYSHAGFFQSIGWKPLNSLNTDFVDFAEAHGIDVHKAHPKSLESLDEDLSDFNIVIDLSGEARNYLPRLSYHTILLQWPVTDAHSPEAVFNQLSNLLEDLMLRLFGNDHE